MLEQDSKPPCPRLGPGSAAVPGERVVRVRGEPIYVGRGGVVLISAISG